MHRGPKFEAIQLSRSNTGKTFHRLVDVEVGKVFRAVGKHKHYKLNGQGSALLAIPLKVIERRKDFWKG